MENQHNLNNEFVADEETAASEAEGKIYKKTKNRFFYQFL